VANASREIRIPFRIGADGDIDTVSNETDQITQRIRMVVLTRLGERIMEPTFGSPLPDFLFEDTDPVTMAEMAVRIESAVGQWVPEAHVVEVRPVFDRVTEGIAQFDVLFTVPPRQDVFSTLVTVGGDVTGVSNG
jgi:phage baseplate assembly protein W